MIDYELEPDLSVEEFIDVLVRSTWRNAVR